METHDEEGRIALMSENQIYKFLGLREEETTNVPAIPTSDVIASEMVISYDNNNSPMDMGTIYPSMEEFKKAVRQFAINKSLI